MAILQTQFDSDNRTVNFTFNKGFTSNRTLVVKQNAITSATTRGLALVHPNPVGIQLGYCIGAARTKRRCLLFWNFLYQGLEIGGHQDALINVVVGSELPVIAFAQFNACNFGNSLGFIGGLQRTS